MVKSKVSDYRTVNAKGVAVYVKQYLIDIVSYINVSDDELIDKLSQNYSLTRLKRMAVNLENVYKDLRKL